MAHRKPPWHASVYMNGKKHWLGSFETQAEAERAEREFKEKHNLPKNRREITAKSHATLKLMGTNANQNTKKKKNKDASVL